MFMLKSFIYLHLSIFLAGWTGLFGKLVDLRESMLLFYRMALTMIFLTLIWALAGKCPPVSGKNLVPILGTGMILALHWLLFYGAIQHSNVSVGVTCYATIGFFTAILEPLLLKRKFSLAELGLSILTLVGIALMFSVELHYRLGIILGVASALVAACFAIFTKKISQSEPPMSLLFFELLGGFIGVTLLLPLYITIEPGTKLMPGAVDWIYLSCFAFFCTIGLYYFQIKSLEKISAFTLSLSYNLEPVYSILLAMWIFKEHKTFTLPFYISLLLIVIAVAGQSCLMAAQQKKSTPQ